MEKEKNLRETSIADKYENISSSISAFLQGVGNVMKGETHRRSL